MTEAQKEYIITEKEWMRVFNVLPDMAKQIYSRPYNKSSDKVICPQSSVCKPSNCTHRKPHLKSERCKENDDTKCDVCDECRSANPDAVLDDFGVWIKTEWVQESIKDYKEELRTKERERLREREQG